MLEREDNIIKGNKSKDHNKMDYNMNNNKTNPKNNDQQALKLLLLIDFIFIFILNIQNKINFLLMFIILNIN